jgi:hypothetical protein
MKKIHPLLVNRIRDMSHSKKEPISEGNHSNFSGASCKETSMSAIATVKIPALFHGQNYQIIKRWAIALGKRVDSASEELKKQTFNDGINTFAFIIWGIPNNKAEFQARYSCLNWHYERACTEEPTDEEIIREFHVDPKV